MGSNTYNASRAAIAVVGGCQIARTPEDINYQTTLTGVLIEGSTEYVRRNNGVNSSFAGCNPEKFLQYYSANGSDTTGIKPGSSTIIRESAFTEEANPELVAAYPTYRDYLFGEHLLQYPAAYGALLRDGKANTHLIGGLRFVDIHGESVPRYPAAAGRSSTTASRSRAQLPDWKRAHGGCRPSMKSTWLMHDRVLTSADRESDPVNRTLSRLGKTTCYGSGYYPWTSCEYNSYGAFVYGGSTGGVNSNFKYGTFAVRPVSAL